MVRFVRSYIIFFPLLFRSFCWNRNKTPAAAASAAIVMLRVSDFRLYIFKTGWIVFFTCSHTITAIADDGRLAEPNLLSCFITLTACLIYLFKCITCFDSSETSTTAHCTHTHTQWDRTKDEVWILYYHIG